MSEINRDFKNDVAKRLSGVTLRRQLPEAGLSAEQVAEEVKDHLNLGVYDWKSGMISGAVYHVSEEISKVACDAYSLTAYTNPLHADVFPGVNKMEAEIVRMAVNLFHGDDDCCGTVTTGGTESILMACKAFRDYGYSKGITNPQIVVPSTVHSAFDKAAQYLGLSVVTVPVNPDTMKVDIEKVKAAIGRRTILAAQYLGLSVVTVPVNPDTMKVDIEKVKAAIGRRTVLIVVPSTIHFAFDKAAQHLGLSVVTVPVNPTTMKVDIEKVKAAIGRRTILIVGSAPNYPYGTMDEISLLSDVALEYGVPLHVDACLGGFVAAFMPAAGHHVPPFDFALPGVASMSADTHKCAVSTYSARRPPRWSRSAPNSSTSSRWGNCSTKTAGLSTPSSFPRGESLITHRTAPQRRLVSQRAPVSLGVSH
ncbi:putative glutamate decarboxylase/sphingosine phosphate lyase [Operophtera brumata]|uniref:Putative glutamate decarboxylase/sphingosine phosphate lyase n=1 Tax=Operophtera brumata TaxID=104452 RepID=A0A0L7KWL1_OPEBR|nr:putative glutamate decarboxylase/sphingosine phosphate lyase [Operophtera brumata]